MKLEGIANEIASNASDQCETLSHGEAGTCDECLRLACRTVAIVVAAECAEIADRYASRFDSADKPPSLQYGCDEIAGEIRALVKR